VNRRELGRTGLSVSEVGFGAARIGGILARGDSREALRLLERALDAGITYYDTANIYSQGESEALIGKAFRRRRGQVVLATKGGYCIPGQRRLIARAKPLVRPVARMLGIRRERLPAAVSGTLSQDFRPERLLRALEGSLRRLRTDCVDLYQLHSPPRSVLARDDWIQALERARQQGKLRHWGVSAETVEDALLAVQRPGIALVQLPFGLLDPEPLAGCLERAHGQGVAVVARGCYGGGLLKESLGADELRAATEKWRRVMALREAASRLGRPLLQAALHFSLRAPRVSVTLVGMRTMEHLEENLAHLAAPPLTDAEFAALHATATSPLPPASA